MVRDSKVGQRVKIRLQGVDCHHLAADSFWDAFGGGDGSERSVGLGVGDLERDGIDLGTSMWPSRGV